jgi:Protein of unknown function (DUF4232)
MRGTRSPGYLAASAVLGVAALTALAGCKSGSSAAASHAQKAVSGAQSAAGSAVSSAKAHTGQLQPVGPAKPGVPGLPSTGSLPGAPSGLGTCNPADLAKSFTYNMGDQGGLPPTDGAGMIVLTNRSSSPCILQGYAGVGMISGNGSRLGMQDVNLSTAGTPAKVDLASGDSAYQGVDFASVAACPAVADAAITAPGTNTPSMVPMHYASGGSQGTNGPLRLCPGVMNLGPLQPTQAAALASIAHHAVPVPANLVP